MSAHRFRLPDLCEQQILDRVEVDLLGSQEAARERYGGLMERHHYLPSDGLVGEQLRYVAEVDGRWVALLSWSAAAQHLKDREQWVGWSDGQRRRRLALVANNPKAVIGDRCCFAQEAAVVGDATAIELDLHSPCG